MARYTLSSEHVGQFQRDGYLVIRQAFPAAVGRECADAVLEALKAEKGIDLSAPPRPRFVVPRRSGPPFDKLNSETVLGAFDALMGVGGWDRSHVDSHGAFFVTFPGFHGSKWHPPVGVGRWHIDLGYASVDAFRLEDGNCGVVPVFLLTPNHPNGAATVVAPGSHRLIARLLRSVEAPVPRWELVAFCEAFMARRTWASRVVQLVGEAGDVAILHPLLIHCASANTTEHVRIMCNTGVGLTRERQLGGMAVSEVEETIRDAIEGLGRGGCRGARIRALLRVNHAWWKLRYTTHGNLPDTVDHPKSALRGFAEKRMRMVGAALAGAIAANVPGGFI